MINNHFEVLNQDYLFVNQRNHLSNNQLTAKPKITNHNFNQNNHVIDFLIICLITFFITYKTILKYYKLIF